MDGAGKWHFLGFWLLGFSKEIIFLFFPNENQLSFHMRYHLFLHYKCFFQNLGKDFIWTNMHTTVTIWIFSSTNWGQECSAYFFKTLTVRTVGAVCMIKHQVLPRRGWWINLGMGLVPIEKVCLIYIWIKYVLILGYVVLA